MLLVTILIINPFQNYYNNMLAPRGGKAKYCRRGDRREVRFALSLIRFVQLRMIASSNLKVQCQRP